MGGTGKAVALLVVAIASGTPSTAFASVIMGAGSLPGANPINLPAVNYTGSGPVVVGGGISWESNQSNSLYGWTGGYAAGNNNIAPGDPPIIAVNDAYDVGTGGYAKMWLSFAAPTSGFLAELFWTDGEFTNLNSSSIYIYDSSMTLLEFAPLNNNGGSTGMLSGYYGFSRPTADISYVYFANSHIGARNLSFVGPEVNPAVGAVPEPATWAMMLLGLGGIGFVGSRLRRNGKLLQLA